MILVHHMLIHDLKNNMTQSQEKHEKINNATILLIIDIPLDLIAINS